VTEKLPYWQHPSYDPYDDPSSGIVQFETLRPITTQLLYRVISECICSVEPEKHDPELLTYSFSDNSNEDEEFPSVCSLKNYSEPGELLFYALEENREDRFEFWIKKLHENLFLLRYERQLNEPLWDSGEDAAWEGGNVDFSSYEFTEEMRLQEEKVIQEEIDRIQTENAKYEPYPIEPPLLDAILIKSDATALSKSVFEFLSDAFPQLTEILKFCTTKYQLPSQLKFGGWMELTINGNSDRAFYNSFEACFKNQAKEETS
jgi:hypothetical protein